MSDTQKIASEIEEAIAEQRESAAEMKRWLLALARRVEAIEEKQCNQSIAEDAIEC
jgi:uncharacterized coiled-coil protein SlyX